MRNRDPLTSHILISDERKLILYLTPKAGCSSVKESILKGCGYSLGRELEAGFDIAEPEDVEGLTYDAHALVRNPTHRIFSCWKNKIKWGNRKEIREKWGNRFYRGMPFYQFLQAIKELPPEEMNQHCRPMVFEMTTAGKFIPNYIWKLEDLIDDYSPFKQAMKKYGIECPDLGHLNRTKDISIVKEVTPMIADMLWAIYHEDYVKFGYEHL